jgi:hypothetical protein
MVGGCWMDNPQKGSKETKNKNSNIKVVAESADGGDGPSC